SMRSKCSFRRAKKRSQGSRKVRQSAAACLPGTGPISFQSAWSRRITCGVSFHAVDSPSGAASVQSARFFSRLLARYASHRLRSSLRAVRKRSHSACDLSADALATCAHSCCTRGRNRVPSGGCVGAGGRLVAGVALSLTPTVARPPPPPVFPPLRTPPQQPVPRLGEALDPRCTALRRGQRAEVAERRVGRVKLAPARAGLARLRAGELLHPSAQRLQPLHVLRLELRPLSIGFLPALPEAPLGGGEPPCQGVGAQAGGQRCPARSPASRERLPSLRRRHGRRLGERLGLLDEHLELAAGRVGCDPLPRARREPFTGRGEATAQLASQLLG